MGHRAVRSTNRTARVFRVKAFRTPGRDPTGKIKYSNELATTQMQLLYPEVGDTTIPLSWVDVNSYKSAFLTAEEPGFSCRTFDAQPLEGGATS